MNQNRGWGFKKGETSGVMGDNKINIEKSPFLSKYRMFTGKKFIGVTNVY